MNPSDPENTADTPKLQDITAAAQVKAREALKSGQDYARENPAAVALGALVLGVVIGILCGQREPKRKDAAQVARDLVDDFISQVSGRLPDFKKQSCRASSLLKESGQKIKWW